MGDLTPSLTNPPPRVDLLPNGSVPGISPTFPPEALLFGRMPGMQAVRDQIEAVAGTELPVLIQGESGTGKELIARLIHAKSSRAGKFVLAGTSHGELLGPAEGAINGGGQAGSLQMAQGGTLFLDEVTGLDARTQDSLLKLLNGSQNGTDTRSTSFAGIRVVSGASRDIEQAIATGIFQQALFERISAINLRLLPLRDRSVDIPDLAQYFLILYSERSNCHARRLSSRIIDQMQRYEWPGNIRQLENLMKWYVICGCEKVIESELERTSSQNVCDVSMGGRFSLKTITREVVREVEGRIIREILQANHWNRRRTARALNISYRALSYKIKEAHLAPSGTSEEFRRD